MLYVLLQVAVRVSEMHKYFVFSLSKLDCYEQLIFLSKCRKLVVDYISHKQQFKKRVVVT